MIPTYLEAVKARIKAATPGPWTVEQNGFETIGQVCCEDWAINEGHMDIGDATLIAHAPQDLATLIRVVELQQEALKYYAEHWDDDLASKALDAADKLVSE